MKPQIIIHNFFKMSKRYLDYYNSQIGGGLPPTDYGAIYKIPRRIQKGRGIGSIFTGLFRFLKQ